MFHANVWVCIFFFFWWPPIYYCYSRHWNRRVMLTFKSTIGIFMRLLLCCLCCRMLRSAWCIMVLLSWMNSNFTEQQQRLKEKQTESAWLKSIAKHLPLSIVSLQHSLSYLVTFRFAMICFVDIVFNIHLYYYMSDYLPLSLSRRFTWKTDRLSST